MRKEGSRILGGVIALIVGLFVILVATGVIGSDEAAFRAPRWVIGLCGALFVVAGLVGVTARYRMLRRILVVVLLAALFVVAAWACVFTKAESWTVGLPFLSRRANGLIAKTLAGFGAVVLLWMLITAVRRLRVDRDLPKEPGGDG
ncbi:MAG: hypothetical protein JSU94_05735 [Phycisphaerales bacterium]|nr:MAG: hypothetical protein JSU94_05735 [Phycisphaerales bacterium]